MRLLIPMTYQVKGGVEKVTLSLIREFLKIVEEVILILPHKDIPHFRKLLGNNENLVIKDLESGSERGLGLFLLSCFNRLRFVIGNKIADDLMAGLRSFLRSQCIKKVSRSYHATHCLYMIPSFQSTPKLGLPLAVIVNDLFWRYKPKEYPADFVKKYDEDLEAWIAQADILFCISNKTKKELTDFRSESAHKYIAIPLAADVSKTDVQSSRSIMPRGDGAEVVFYNPAGLGKGQLTLFKAVRRLLQEGVRNFKVVLSGSSTELLIQKKFLMKKEWEDARVYYDEHRVILNDIIEAKGYCSIEEVENIYDHADCVVLCADYEGFGLPFCEGIVRGLPVICSDLDAYHEQADFYDCRDRSMFFPINDDISLAQKMKGFLDHPLPRLSHEETKRRFGHWTWESVAKEYVRYLDAIGRGKSRTIIRDTREFAWGER